LLSNFFDGSSGTKAEAAKERTRDRRLESGHRFPQAALDGFEQAVVSGKQRPLKRPRYKDHK